MYLIYFNLYSRNFLLNIRFIKNATILNIPLIIWGAWKPYFDPIGPKIIEPKNVESLQNAIDGLHKNVRMSKVTYDLSNEEYNELLTVLSDRQLLDKILKLIEGKKSGLTRNEIDELKRLRIIKVVENKIIIDEKGRLLAQLISSNMNIR